MSVQQQNNVDPRLQQALDGLAGCREDNPVYTAVLALVDFQIERCNQMTLEEGLTDSLVHRRAGAEWQLRQFRASLQIMHRQANERR